MRHRKRRGKLSMMTARRNATLRNMVKSLLRHQRIQTILARAKEARRLAEHVVSLAKTDTIASRRRAYSILTDRDMVTKLFKEIAPLFRERTSGFTRIIPLGFRRGDGANLCILELTEKKIIERRPKKKKEKARPEVAKPEAPAAKPGAHEAARKPKEAPKLKTISKGQITLEEEKRIEKAKTESKKIADKKGFLKNLRGFFRRKTDM